MPTTRTRKRRPVPVSPAVQRLGERLREARTEAGLSQAQLGDPHFTRAHISAIELGKIRPAMTSLEFLAVKLGKSVSYFLEDEGESLRRSERKVSRVRASQLIAEGKPTDAIELLLPLLDGAVLPRDRAETLRLLGRAYWEAGVGTKAVTALEEALGILRAAADGELIARTRAQLGMALHLLMGYEEAAEQLNEALKAVARGEVRDPLFKVHVLHNLGLTFYQRNDFTTALQYFERAQTEGADIGDTKWLASLYAAMGMSRHQLGDHESAVVFLRKSEALFESIRNRSRSAEIRFFTGLALRALGNKSAGREAIETAYRGAVEVKNEILATRISINAAACLAEDGEIAESIKRFDLALADADALNNLPLKAAARIGLGRALKNHDTARAERVLREAATMLEHARQGAPELGETYNELSQTLANSGRSEEALKYSARAYELAHGGKGR